MSGEFGAFRLTKHTRRRPERDAFEPRFEQTDQIRGNIQAVYQAERDLLAYRPDDLTWHRAVREALVRNTYGTVSIEGNPLSLSRVRSLLAEAPSPAQAQDLDERDVLNLASFLGQLQKEHAPQTLDDVLHLHGRLLAGTVAAAGRFKETANFIGNPRTRTVAFIPADPSRVQPELEVLLRWYDTTDLPVPLAVGTFFHEFESIHPFLDGNGRLGRAIATAQLHDAGFVGVRLATVDFAINADRANFYQALASGDDPANDLTEWLTYFTHVLRTGYEDAVQRFLFDTSLPEALSSDEAALAVWIARRARHAPHRRFKVADMAYAFPHIARRTLQRMIANLVDTGILDAHGTGRAAFYALATRSRTVPSTVNR